MKQKSSKRKITTKYPITWEKNNLSLKIFCSIPNIATGILLRAGNNHFIIDPGDGILRDLNKELDTDQLKDISGLFVTHGHHDHVGGIWSLLTYLRVMHKTTPLTIYYPEGCREIDSLYSAFQKVYSKSIPYPIILKEIGNTRSLSGKGVTVKPFPVIHKEVISEELNKKGTLRQVPALGFLFKFKGTSICYGGDTAYCPALEKMAKDADLAVLEAGHEADTDPDEMHMTEEEATRIGESAKEYVLVHVPD